MTGSVPSALALDADFKELLATIESKLEALPDKPDETPLNTLLALWALAAGHPLALSQVSDWEYGPLDETGRERLRASVKRRLDGVPLAHLTRRQDFMGLVLLAGSEALIPRKETELLGYAAAEKARSADADNPLVLDVCTGGGNLALAIAHLVPTARVLGSDLAPEAVELARANARYLGREDVEFRCGDLLAPFQEDAFTESVDVLICNPPYISSARVETMAAEISRHEPKLAFDGGPFGVNILRRLISQGPNYLKPGGWLMFEVGLGQGEQAARLAQRATLFEQSETLRDAAGEIRAIALRKTGTEE